MELVLLYCCTLLSCCPGIYHRVTAAEAQIAVTQAWVTGAACAVYAEEGDGPRVFLPAGT